MGRNEALAAAKTTISAFRMADYRFLAGNGQRPDPRDFGLSGTVNQPGNMITVNGFTFSLNEVEPATFPVHAGF